MDSATENTARRVRFRPPGIDREERVGTIFGVTIDSLHGTTYYIEDESGGKYQLAPGSVLAAEETEL
jgi:hypothetical protein